ncbi:hypothetical protein AWJ20_5167 [Sugiyamaella lignohabitans]|uniref:CDT1 Geminin-binding domain-containing protein n=1 Tax=Sugiyamaella lignohabitans TaxID=796027 RepID=A0A167EL87_9ASCO|nr:uncharacterized protein AWJ20_5167 [Sugiyamaella lignohabitans]ANB14206.1 hypothetical protein AWJ20_5167 [Sugiyamaella lignohabitans]
MTSKKTTSLVQVFKSIDASFIFYYATSNSNTMTFAKLKTRVAHQSRMTLQLAHLSQIKAIYPSAYNIDTSYVDHNDYLISAPMVIQNAKQRLAKFEQLLNNVNNTDNSASELPLADLSSSRLNRKRPSSDRLESLRKKSVSNIANQNKMKQAVPKTSYANLLEKIRAKQKLNELTPRLSEEEKRQKFITGQLESVSAVLLGMSNDSSQVSVSYSLPFLITKLKDSLRCKLSAQDAESAIVSLAAKLPQFCSVVEVGKVRAVKISHNTSLGHIRQQLACPPV